MSKGVLALCLTLCAIGGVATAAASAANPEYAVWPNKVTSFKGGEATLEPAVSKTGIVCKSSENSMEVVTLKSGTAQIAFKECKSITLKAPCKTTGAAEGEIKVSGATWKLVFLSKAAHEVATLLQGGEALSRWASITCGGSVHEELRGSVLAKTTPVNTKSKSFTLALQGSHGTQAVTQYETESGEKATAALEMNVSGGAFEAADLNTSLTQTWEKENEIIAL